MLLFIAFPEVEIGLLKAAAEKLSVSHRCAYFDDAAEGIANSGTDTASRKFPAVIFLNVDADNWHAMLEAFKQHSLIGRIPLVALGNERSQEDVVALYEAGANSFIVKPKTFRGMMEAGDTALSYWLHTTQLPQAHLADL